jgi:hypothetical protein
MPLLPFDCYFLAAFCAVRTDQPMRLKAACGTLATAGRHEWTRGQTAPGSHSFTDLDDKMSALKHEYSHNSR